MTDVLILHRIPGLRAGRIVPLTDRLRNHVKAGNARLLPDSEGYDSPDPDQPAPVLTTASTGTGLVEPNGPDHAAIEFEFERDDEDTEDDG